MVNLYTQREHIDRLISLIDECAQFETERFQRTVDAGNPQPL